jgi:hypothetical protein
MAVHFGRAGRALVSGRQAFQLGLIDVAGHPM